MYLELWHGYNKIPKKIQRMVAEKLDLERKSTAYSRLTYAVSLYVDNKVCKSDDKFLFNFVFRKTKSIMLRSLY